MLRLSGPGVRLCDGWTRREVMRIGGIGFLGGGLSLTDLLRTPARAQSSPLNTSTFGRARSCIVLFLLGGPPQHSTWDPKPRPGEHSASTTSPRRTVIATGRHHLARASCWRAG